MNLNIKDTFEGIKEFKPLSNKEVKIYSCGPTVYNFVTIGNLRSFITSDIIKKSLRFIGFKVLDVMNITDVGHLTGDADNTEDKIEVSAKKQNKDIHEIINFYTDYFFSVIDKVNIKQSNVIARASEEVQTQIELIKILEKKGFVYQSETGVYFDISKFSDYKKYARQDINLQLIGARKEVHKDKTKKHPYDFRLWQTSYPNHLMQWDSPWGRGFPGWHIECSAIIYKYLGESIDIHTGGTDLIYPHHVNEIAQSVSAFSSKFVNFWIHNEMVLLNGVKMAKSLGNVYLIEDIEKRGINPLVLRYFYMSAHFSSLINFTFDTIDANQNALNRIYNFLKLNNQYFKKDAKVSDNYRNLFIQRILDNFDTPGMIEVLWKLIKDKDVAIDIKIATMLDFDSVLSLDFYKYLNKPDIPKDILELLDKRSSLRDGKFWAESDKIRSIIEDRGYLVVDLEDKSFITKKV